MAYKTFSKPHITYAILRCLLRNSRFSFRCLLRLTFSKAHIVFTARIPNSTRIKFVKIAIPNLHASGSLFCLPFNVLPFCFVPLFQTSYGNSAACFSFTTVKKALLLYYTLRFLITAFGAGFCKVEFLVLFGLLVFTGL